MEKNNINEEKDEKYYKKLTIPNIITSFRIVSSLALCSYIAINGITSPLLITLATLGIGLTDAVDGYLARNCGMSSWLGSVLDPIADKVYTWGLGATLMATGIMPLWPLLIAVRDASMFAFTSYQFKKNGKELLPTKPAKLKMLLQSTGVVSTLAFGFGSSGLSLIAPICMAGAIATVVPEVICVKKKYFSEKNNGESLDIPAPVIEIEETKIQEKEEKNKSIEYSPNAFVEENNKENFRNLEKPKVKVKKKSLFK